MKAEIIPFKKPNDMVKELFPKITDWEWIESKNEHDFLENFKAAAHAKYHKFDGQVELYKEECRDILNADRADHALALAKEHKLKSVRHFMNYNVANNNRFRVDGGRKFDWMVSPVGKFNEKIPLSALETLTFLRQNGVDPDGFGIGVAVPKPKPKPVPVTDPVLLVRFGRYWVEIWRWG